MAAAPWQRIDIFDPDPEKPSVIPLSVLESALTRGAVHYVALGDKHSRTEVGTTGRVCGVGVSVPGTVDMATGRIVIASVSEAIQR